MYVDFTKEQRILANHNMSELVVVYSAWCSKCWIKFVLGSWFPQSPFKINTVICHLILYSHPPPPPQLQVITLLRFMNH